MALKWSSKVLLPPINLHNVKVLECSGQTVMVRKKPAVVRPAPVRELCLARLKG